MALTDYSIDTSGTPQDVLRRQKLAEALMQQGGDTSAAAGGKNGGWLTGINRALAGALGGYQAGQVNSMAQGQRKQEADLMASYPGANPVASMGTVPQALSKSAPIADTAGKIYENDEPSPLDPPSGADRQKMMATILGEAGNEPQLGKNAVASVIRTRAVDGGYGGDTPSGVVTAPNQFEPWNTPEGRARMARALTDPKQAAAADAAIRSAYGEGGKAPEDPTEGMTHFFSPKGQAALGRSPPAWAGGDSVTIGGHVFNSPDEAPGKPVQVASAQGFAPQDSVVAAVNGAAAGQPQQLAQADPQAAQRQALAAWAQKAMLSTNPQTRQLAVQTIEQLNKQQGLINAGSGKIYDPTTKTWLKPPKDPEADIPDNFEKAPDGTLQPVKGGPADPEYIAKASGAKKSTPDGSGLSPAALEIRARQWNRGDYDGATKNVGRGAQGGKTLEAISNQAAQLLVEEGMTPEQAAEHVSANMQKFRASGIGQSAEARTGATREANLNIILKAADAAIPAALQASEKLDRTGWVPINNIIQHGEVIASNPELREFGMANLQLAEHWARAMNPTGVMRESDRDKALGFLSTADSKTTYKRVVEQLRTQITRERDAIRSTRPGEAAAASPAQADPLEGKTAHNSTTGETLIRKGGKWVPTP